MKILIFGDISDWNIKNFSIDKIPRKYISKIKSADLCIFNLEGPICTNTEKRSRIYHQNWFIHIAIYLLLKLFNKEQPVVTSSKVILNLLTINKNTVVTLANNHIKDGSLISFKETLELLRKNNIKFVGAGLNYQDSIKPIILKVAKKKIGIINTNYVGLKKHNFFLNIYGASKKSYGASYIPKKQLNEFAKKVKSQYDDIYLIQIIHAGKEMKSDLHQTKLPIDLVENSSDLTIFHHPHQHFDLKTNKAYLLGDFVFYRPNSKMKESRKGAFLEVLLTNKKSNITTYTYSYSKGFPDEKNTY